MASLKERLTGKVERLRQRHQIVDHLARLVRHYGKVNGNAQAGAVTFFGFLSFFPLLALGFFTVGQLAKVYDAKRDLVQAINEVLPGIVGPEQGQIPLSTFEENAAAIGLLGLAGVLYAGLNWLSGMRDALEVMFEMPKRAQPGFVLGKGRDLASLAVIGFVLIVSVGLSGLLTAFTEALLGFVGLEETVLTKGLVGATALVLGVVATTVLFLATFRLLVDPDVPKPALLHGAFFGAVAFEVLKSLAGLLLAGTRDQPAFQAFGIALILVVWINYFSRVVMLAAAWAYTSPLAVEARAARNMHMPGAALTARPGHGVDEDPGTRAADGAAVAASGRRWLAVGAVGGAGAMAAAAAVARRRPTGG